MRTSSMSREIAPQTLASTSAVPAVPPSLPPDRISLEGSKGAQIAMAIARSASAVRWAAQAEQLGAQVTSGLYQVDAAHLASQILSAAEMDARISALFT
jgi:hypothetical protein